MPISQKHMHEFPDLSPQRLEQFRQAASELKQENLDQNAPRLAEIVAIMRDFNEHVQQGRLQNKKWVQALGMDHGVEQALTAIFAFASDPQKRSAHRPDIAALVAALLSEAQLLRHHLEQDNLEDEYRLGKRVEKSNPTKQS